MTATLLYYSSIFMSTRFSDYVKKKFDLNNTCMVHEYNVDYFGGKKMMLWHSCTPQSNNASQKWSRNFIHF